MQKFSGSIKVLLVNGSLSNLFFFKMNDKEINDTDKNLWYNQTFSSYWKWIIHTYDIQISNHFKFYDFDRRIFHPSKLEMKALTNNMI